MFSIRSPHPRWYCRSLLSAILLLAPQVTAQDASETPQTSADAAAEPAAAASQGPAVDATSVGGEAAARQSESDALQFSFTGTPWREVIQWIASEADLALHVGDLPPGTFSYSDPEVFTPEQAINRINLFLLPEGFTLVRSGRLLSVINLADQRSLQQLDALAELVTVEELQEVEAHDVVKCFFALGDISAEDAVDELAALNLMSTPAVFTKTNQLLITDTAAKLRNVKAVLDAFESSQLDKGNVVKSFALQHVDAEDILLVARPHLGLATGEMIGIDVSLSSDVQGNNIYVTGVEDKVKLIEGIVKAIDQPSHSSASSEQARELRSHLVPGGNVETVYSVLQTLLAEKSVRLSMDSTAGTIVALASPEVQAEIAQTVTQLQASDAEFEVIPLKTVDPYFAISLLEQMLDLGPSLDDSEQLDADAPKIDADPGNRRLFVRAKQHQIEQIKNIVAGLEMNASLAESDQMRILPMKGQHAVELLETAATFWRAAHPILLYPTLTSNEPQDTERVPNGEPGETSTTANDLTATPSASDVSDLEPRLLSENSSSQAPAIRCQLTPRGLVLQSEDSQALDRFEEHLRTLAGPVDSLPSPPIVFYLKHTKPDDALRMLGELLDGGESAKVSQGNSLVNGYVPSSSSGSFLGSMVTSREGTTTMMSGAITVVADSRLNRLIAQGTAADIELIESYLKIIDKDTSITSIETYGTSHVIELVNTKASEVAEAIREAYSGRIAGEDEAQASAARDPRRAAAQAAAAAEEKRGDEQNPGARLVGQPDKSLEPKISVAVHEPSNSLIITAPQQLFEEVEKLVQLIDERGEKSVEVVSAVNIATFEAVQQALTGEVSSPSDRTASRRDSSSSRDNSSRGRSRRND